MNSPFLETSRLILRPLANEDFSSLHAVLSKEKVMYAWEKVFYEQDEPDFKHAAVPSGGLQLIIFLF